MMKRKLMIAPTMLLLLLAVDVQAKGSVQRGADLAYDCVDCHGMEGKGTFETPPIAGLDQAHILKQLRAFQGGKKKSMDDMMHTYTEDRTDQDLQDLAAYWASKEK